MWGGRVWVNGEDRMITGRVIIKVLAFLVSGEFKSSYYIIRNY